VNSAKSMTFIGYKLVQWLGIEALIINYFYSK
jgi:hypothetical protein